MYRYAKPEGKAAWKLIENSEKGIQRAINDGATFYTILSLDQDLDRVNEDEAEKVKIHYKGPLYFDLDSKDDESRTLYDVRKLLLKLYSEYGVNLQDLIIHCTGGKGFHVLVPAKIFSNGKAQAYLPYTYKNMAKEFYLETLDYSIYSGGKGRMWRIENIERPNKRYKVRLTATQIFCMTFEEIHALTMYPGEPSEMPKEVEASPELSALFRASEYKAPKLTAQGVADEKLKGLDGTPGCMSKIKALSEIKEGRSFNQIAMAFASYAAGMGWTWGQLDDFSRQAIKTYESSVYKKDSEKFSHLRSIFNYYISQKNYKFNCLFIRKTVQCESDCCPKCKIMTDTLDGEYDPTLGIETTPTAYFKRSGDSRQQLTTFSIKPNAVIEFIDKHHREYTICANLVAATGRTQEVIFYQPDWGSRSSFLKKLPHPDFAYVGGDIDVTKIFHVLNQIGDIPKRIGVRTIGMHQINDRWHFVSHDGSVSSDGIFDEIVLENEYPLSTNLVRTALPTEKDVAQVMTSLFNFNAPEITVPLVGWFVAAFFKERIFKFTKQFPLLFVFGAAGAGKTQSLLCLKNMFALDSDNIKSIADLTAFTLISAANSNNTIPLILDEFKSTTFSVYQVKMVSKLIRAAYNNESGERGQANQTIRQYFYRSPIILAGEQTVTEPAARDRILEVHMSKALSAPHLQEFKQLQRAPLDKFGRLIMARALSITDEEVQKLLDHCLDNVPEVYMDRPRLNQAVMDFGLEILKEIVDPYGYANTVAQAKQKFRDKQPDLDKDEIEERRKTDVDRILEAIALMAEHERYKLWPKQHFEVLGDRLIINMRLVYSMYLRFAEEYKVDAEPMNYVSFQKLAKKETYYLRDNVPANMSTGMALCMEFDTSRLQAKKLNMLSILAGTVEAEKPLDM